MTHDLDIFESGKNLGLNGLYVGCLKDPFWDPFCFHCTCFRLGLFLVNTEYCFIVMPMTCKYMYQ